MSYLPARQWVWGFGGGVEEGDSGACAAVFVPVQCGCPVVCGMLRAAVAAPVAIDMTQIPRCAGLDPFAAACADRVSGRDDGLELLA